MALTDGLVASYPLSGSPWTDASGGGHALTASGDVSSGAGFHGVNAAYFSGYPGYLSGSAFSLTSLTVSCWVNVGGNRIRSFLDQWATNQNFILGCGYDGTVYGAVYAGTSGVNTSIAINDGAWHFLALSFDDSTKTLKQYVDGHPPVTTVYSSYDVPSASSAFYIGRDSFTVPDPSNPGGGASSIAGAVGDACVWNRALSGNEIYNLYYRGAGNAYPFSAPTISPPRFDLSNSATIFLF